MRLYLLKRVLYSLLVMWGVATLVFFMLRAIPGDPVTVILGEEATPAAVEQLRRNLGLDGPFYVQYARWFGRLRATMSATGEVEWARVEDPRLAELNADDPEDVLDEA